MRLAIQFSADKLAEMIVARLKGQKLCFDPLDDQTLVDHIDFPAKAKVQHGPVRSVWIPIDELGTTREATGPTLQVAIPLNVHKVNLVDLRAAGLNPPATELITALQVLLELDVSSDASWLIVTFIKLQILGGGSTPQLDQLNAQLVGKVGQQYVPFIDVQGSLKAMGSGGLTVAWAGMSLNLDQAAVEVRIEYQDIRATDDLTGWGQFYAGSFADLVGVDDWAFFIDRNLIMPAVQRIFATALASDPSHFALRSGIFLTWFTDPKIVVAFSGVAISACNCFFTNIDVPVDVQASITFGVTANQLSLDVKFDYTTDPGSSFCCEVTAGLFFPIVGTAYLLDGKIGTRDYILGLVGWVFAAGVGDTIGAMVALGGKPAPVPNPGGACSKTSDGEITCTYPLPADETASFCNSWRPTVRTANAVRGNESGLIVTGSLQVADIAPATIGVEVAPFLWSGLDVNCSGPVGTLSQTAEVMVSDPLWSSSSPHADLYLCEARVLDHPEFDAALSESYTYCPFVTTVSLVLPADVALTAPVEVLLRTSAGARVATIDPVSAPFDYTAFETEARAWQLAHCFNQPDPWWKRMHRYNPVWSVDPGPEGGGEQQHLWEVLVSHIPEGTLVALVGAEGQMLMERAANAGGTAVLWAGVSPGGPSEVGVVRATPQAGAGSLKVAGAAGSVKPVMQIRQFLLRRIGEVGFATSAKLIDAGRQDGAVTFTVLTQTGLETYGLANPVQPVLTGRVPLAGAHGALTSALGFVIWGSSGLRFVEPRGVRHNEITVWHRSAVESAAVAFSHAYAIADGELLVFGPSGERVTAIEAADAKQVSVIGDLLVSTSHRGVQIFALAEPARPALVSEIATDAAGGAGRLPFGPTHELRITDSVGVSTIFDVTHPRHPVRVGAATSASWVENSLRFGDLVITMDDARNTVVVAAVIGRRVL